MEFLDALKKELLGKSLKELRKVFLDGSQKEFWEKFRNEFTNEVPEEVPGGISVRFSEITPV